MTFAWFLIKYHLQQYCRFLIQWKIKVKEGSGIDLGMMCEVILSFLWPLPPRTLVTITLSHTCASHPSHCFPFTVLSPVFLSVLVWITFFCLCCFCPAIRIHNHTVLPSSHNSSYVYNDSAYTNISAILGEDPSLFLSLKIICASPTAFCCSLCIATRLSWAFHTFLPIQSSVLTDWNEDFLVCWW